MPPDCLTISERISIADGGIDAEISVPLHHVLPSDSFYRPGLTGFQIKSGTTFKPWTASSVLKELVDAQGNLFGEVKRLLNRSGCYFLICLGHDLTPKQRNDSRKEIAKVFLNHGFPDYEPNVEVLGASQIVEYVERYPGTASMLSPDPIQEGWVVDEWQRDYHMTNSFAASAEQTTLITEIQSLLNGSVKHIRVLGDPGLGKTRIVLEALKDASIAPSALYIQHGSQFGQTGLFRQIIKGGQDKPLILVLDELPESEMTDVWRHFKARCGQLKLISLDHGRDETTDSEIVRLTAPRLPDETIKAILIGRTGTDRSLDRWVDICAGSPRVAQAVADNLKSNPSDILKPPSTIPIWERFLHGYGKRDDQTTRQIDLVTQHVALFSRFGYENPVSHEAIYISQLVQKIDPTIGWGRFQEIVESLRARRVLQGSRTLFFVPRALHIHLWKRFWESYGRAFDYTKTFNEMPESLHFWFMNMFKYAEGPETLSVVDQILDASSVFSTPGMITSAKGSRFLATLAEANPAAVLRLLERTVGTWSDAELLAFKDSRQQIVWALEKIAVWKNCTTRAIRLLSRLAVNENAENSNNATGTLLSLFGIGPEAAATEASPNEKLPALIEMLQSPDEKDFILGTKALLSALNTRRTGYRIVGPEYQGLKERAKLWMPTTYDDWWREILAYFNALIHQSTRLPPGRSGDTSKTLLKAVERVIQVPPCKDIAFDVLEKLILAKTVDERQLSRFFKDLRRFEGPQEDPTVSIRLRALRRKYTSRSLETRFQRYVLDADWLDFTLDSEESTPRSRRTKRLIAGVAMRLSNNHDLLKLVIGQIPPDSHSPALWHFGEYLALADSNFTLLSFLRQDSNHTKRIAIYLGYLAIIKSSDANGHDLEVSTLLTNSDTAWLGATVALNSEFDHRYFGLCLDALQNGWIEPALFSGLRYAKRIKAVPFQHLKTLLYAIEKINSQEANLILVDLLDVIEFHDQCPVPSAFVFEAVSRILNEELTKTQMRAYHWRRVCKKLLKWDESLSIPLLNSILQAMGRSYELSYDHDVQPTANEIVQANPSNSWKVIQSQFEAELPMWRFDLTHWLKGGLGRFDTPSSAGPIAHLDRDEVLAWVDVDPENRAGLVAHAVQPSLDDEGCGVLTRTLLSKYENVEGVHSGISASFHSGSWTGLTSDHLKRKREAIRVWLSKGFEPGVERWLEREIEYLDRRIDRELIDEERERFD